MCVYCLIPNLAWISKGTLLQEPESVKIWLKLQYFSGVARSDFEFFFIFGCSRQKRLTQLWAL